MEQNYSPGDLYVNSHWVKYCTWGPLLFCTMEDLSPELWLAECFLFLSESLSSANPHSGHRERSESEESSRTLQPFCTAVIVAIWGVSITEESNTLLFSVGELVALGLKISDRFPLKGSCKQRKKKFCGNNKKSLSLRSHGICFNNKKETKGNQLEQRGNHDFLYCTWAADI